MKWWLIPFVIVAALCFTQAVFAKRSPPTDVKPVVQDGISYSVPASRMGILIATDVATSKELWALKIYTVIVNPNLEGDVQDVFITSLKIDHDALLISNEHGDEYSVDLKTRKVTVIKGSDTIGK